MSHSKAGPWANGVGYHVYRTSYASTIDQLRAERPKLELLAVDNVMFGPPNPNRGIDTRYSVIDYDDIDPDFGREEDFVQLVREFQESGIGVTIDLVANHTSNAHPWFLDARAGGPKRNWYIPVGDDELDKYALRRPLFPYSPGLPGTHDDPWVEYPEGRFLTSFYDDMPDLDNNNPEVQQEFVRIVRRWVERWGITGIRADACDMWDPEPYTDGVSRAGALGFMRVLRDALRDHPDVFILAEANEPLEHAGRWVQPGLANTAYYFLLSPAIFVSQHDRDWSAVRKVLAETGDIAPDARVSVYARNHDEITVKEAPDWLREGFLGAFGAGGRNRLFYGTNQRTAELLRYDPDAIVNVHALLFCLRGKPWIYAGDEYGDPGDSTLPDRAGVRLPYNRKEVRRQLTQPGSLFNRMRHLIRVRNETPALKWGLREDVLPSAHNLLCFARRLDAETRDAYELTPDGGDVICAFDAREKGEEPGDHAVDLSPWRGRRVVDLVTGHDTWIGWDDYEFELPPKGVSILKVLPRLP